MRGGMPQWTPFREVVGGVIAETRCQFQVVRAFGEMVEISGSAASTTPYYLDNLDSRSYAGLECICKVLLWLQKNMPVTAEWVLAEVRARG